MSRHPRARHPPLICVGMMITDWAVPGAAIGKANCSPL
jgi:hypothetical protein